MIQWQLLDRSHLLSVTFILHLALFFTESPLQKPTSSVVVGVTVVVSTQSSGSSVSIHSQLLRSQPALSVSPAHLACALYDEPRQQPGVTVVGGMQSLGSLVTNHSQPFFSHLLCCDAFAHLS